MASLYFHQNDIEDFGCGGNSEELEQQVPQSIEHIGRTIWARLSPQHQIRQTWRASVNTLLSQSTHGTESGVRENPLGHWVTRACNGYALLQLDFDVLSASPSTSSGERLFNISRLLVTAPRNRLSYGKVRELLCLNQWY